MEHEHFTYPEAIRYLARKYNIEIEETEQTNEEKQIQIFERVCIWFLNLQKTIFIKHFKIRGRKSHRSFLFQRKGFTNETIEKFSLGYSQILGMLLPKRRLGKVIN
jgi:DNA primase